MIDHPAAKAIVAAIVTVATATLIAVTQFIHMSDTAHGWVSVGLAFLGSVGGTVAVYKQPNAKQ